MVFGRNAITVFVLSGLLTKLLMRTRVAEPGGSVSLYTWIYRELFASWSGPMNGSLVFALAHLVVLWLLMLLLHRRDIHLRV